MSDPVIGKPLARLDARDKVRGKATFAADTQITNIAHAVLVTSGRATGHTSAYDTAAAEAAPGVLAVITARNAPKLDAAHLPPHDELQARLALLQDETIAYCEQPIAIVVADTRERAEAAARLLLPAYVSPTPPTAAIDAVLETAVAPTDHPPRFADVDRGDAGVTPQTAHAHIDQTYTTPAHAHHASEPHATLAVWQGSDKLTIYDTTEALVADRALLAQVLGLAPANVRVICHYVGGGFGGKTVPWSHVVLAALAARVVARPVELALSRAQVIATIGGRARTIQRVAIGAGADGKLVAIAHDVHLEAARTPAPTDVVEYAAMPSRMLYACPNVTTTHRLVPIDIPPPTFMRAPGFAVGSFALESALDELAALLALDPLELRTRNHSDVDPSDHRPWSSKSLLACYRQAAATFGWHKRPPRPRATKRGHTLVGWGMASAMVPADAVVASARAVMRDDGTVAVQVAAQDTGDGSYTALAQIAADALTLPVTAVRLELGDTAFPDAPRAGASLTIASTGPAVALACRTLLAKLTQLSIADPKSPLHAAPLVTLDVDDGAVVLAADHGKRDDFSTIVARSGKPEVSATPITSVGEGRVTHSCAAFGAQFCEVEVDDALGTVRVTRFVGAFAAGTIINPTTARNQLAGGIAMGIGAALVEQTVRDPATARVLTRDLVDARIPTHLDVPAIDLILVDEHDDIVNSLGAKGLGELGIVGAAAAVANAIYHATGKRIRDLPITLDKLL